MAKKERAGAGRLITSNSTRAPGRRSNAAFQAFSPLRSIADC
jgi:hypothetical protein